MSPRTKTCLALATCLVLLGSFGCVNTTTSERDVGVPIVRVQQDLLPGPPEVEAVTTRGDDALSLEVSRVRWCRHQEVTTVYREQVEKSKVGTGTAITSAVFMTLGVVTMSAAVFAVGGGIIGLAVLRTGTTTSEAPPRQSVGPASRVVCQRTPAAGALVRVVSAGEKHEGLSDPRGRLELAGVAPGPLRVVVDGVPARVAERPRRASTSVAKSRGDAPPAAPAKPPAAASPPVAAAPPEVAKPPSPPDGAAPPLEPKPPEAPKRAKPRLPPAPADGTLPPPPPPPPGARVVP